VVGKRDCMSNQLVSTQGISLGSDRFTGALLDRLTHRAHILEANGESYRLRQARKRSNWKPSSRQAPSPKEKDT
jgi:DNA replication protein DnaC